MHPSIEIAKLKKSVVELQMELLQFHHQAVIAELDAATQEHSPVERKPPEIIMHPADMAETGHAPAG